MGVGEDCGLLQALRRSIEVGVSKFWIRRPIIRMQYVKMEEAAGFQLRQSCPWVLVARGNGPRRHAKVQHADAIGVGKGWQLYVRDHRIARSASNNEQL